MHDGRLGAVVSKARERRRAHVGADAARGDDLAPLLQTAAAALVALVQQAEEGGHGEEEARRVDGKRLVKGVVVLAPEPVAQLGEAGLLWQSGEAGPQDARVGNDDVDVSVLCLDLGCGAFEVLFLGYVALNSVKLAVLLIFKLVRVHRWSCGILNNGPRRIL